MFRLAVWAVEAMVLFDQLKLREEQVGGFSYLHWHISPWATPKPLLPKHVQQSLSATQLAATAALIDALLLKQAGAKSCRCIR